MPPIQSQVRTSSDGYLENRRQMLELVAELRRLEGNVRAHGERAAEKFARRGQLPPHRRLAELLDPGSPFVELSTLAGLGMHDDDGDAGAMGGSSIAGIGSVSGVRCAILISDSAIKGGAISPMGLQKNLRLQQIALENKLPLLHLVESAGANLNYQSEIFVEGGRIFANLARLSARGIPVLTVVHGSSTAGGAYLPGLSDVVVMVRGRAKVFLAGGPLVKAALGEEADEEELGGAEMHATVTGTAELLADDDGHALELLREVVAGLPWDREMDPPGSGQAPLYDPDELCGVVPVDYRRPYDAREVIARLVDGSELLEYKAGYGIHTVCGRSRLDGLEVGIVANNGPIDPDGATKAAHFIQVCSQQGVPLVYLQNTTGYLVGTRAERAGMVKHGSKMIQAVSNATVPQLTLQIGASFGAGNYGMCGRAFDPRFLFSWPNARIAVMGGEQAADVLAMVQRGKMLRQAEAAGIDVASAEFAPGRDEAEQKIEALRRGVIEQIDRESTAFFASARLWDDGLIDPRDSRRLLAYCLRVCREGDARRTRPVSFGVARM
ncbi:MAG: acyl-CoA carboxylase subunit beta [Thermoanaerobaculia bacterium]|nr:acyl-CoA carboxylase subunit beta [Thermoanaerobaculia bacterium]